MKFMVKLHVLPWYEKKSNKMAFDVQNMFCQPKIVLFYANFFKYIVTAKIIFLL